MHSEQPTLDAVIRFIRDVRTLPGDVADVARRMTLDSLGCMIAGANSPLARPVVDGIAALSTGPSDIIGTRNRVSAHDASYVNAYTADALDFEETLVSHPGAVVVGVGVAVGQARGASWDEMLRAIAAGYEVGSRIGAALIPTSEKRREHAAEFWWKSTAAVTTAGMLMGLDELQWVHAFGYATAASPAARRGGFEQRPLSDLKANYGGQAHVGVIGAVLASQGFRTYRGMLDGRRTFAELLGSDRWEPQVVTRGLGEDWVLRGIGFKVYPACLYLHALLECVDAGIIGRGIELHDVVEIRAYVPAIICQELAEHRPSSVVDAQFSAPVAVATLLLKREPFASWFDEKWLADPILLEVVDRIRLIEDPELTRLQESDGRVRTHVEVEVAHGRVERARVDVVRGNAARPIGAHELRAKFINSVTPTLGLPAAEDAADAIAQAPADMSVSRVVEAMRPREGR
jgi:2-methylcitrate dehydratase PrpD